MPIELTAGEQRELNVALIPGAAALIIERLFVLSYPVADSGSHEVIYCYIRNAGASPVTATFTSYILGFDLVEPPPLLDNNVTFTVNPGEVYQYRRKWWWPIGARAETWVVGDWGQESVRLKWRCGHKWPHGGAVTGAELDCVDVGPSHATLRYSQTIMCDDWEFRYRTPPQPLPYEHGDDFLLQVDDPAFSSFPAIHCAIWDLLSGRTYEAKCTGETREAWTQFTTP